MTTKVLCEGRLNNDGVASHNLNRNLYKTGRRTYPEYLLISSFLRRVRLASIRNALVWIRDNV